jgi:hypothetical protein
VQEITLNIPIGSYPTKGMRLQKSAILLEDILLIAIQTKSK